MVASESFVEFLREQLAPLGPLRARRMFGKTGVFCHGVMIGMVAVRGRISEVEVFRLLENPGP